MNSPHALLNTTVNQESSHAGQYRKQTLRRYQHYTHAGCSLCAVADFYHHDHGHGAGYTGESAESQHHTQLEQTPNQGGNHHQDGTIYLDTYPVGLEELESLLRQYKAVNPELPVVVKADAQIQYQRVVDVLDVMGRLEISQLGLVTQKLVR